MGARGGVGGAALETTEMGRGWFRVATREFHESAKPPCLAPSNPLSKNSSLALLGRERSQPNAQGASGTIVSNWLLR